MRTNSPSDCWQAVGEMEREEWDEERDRQRGACKERKEKTKAECKEWWKNHIVNSKPVQHVLFGRFQEQRATWPERGISQDTTEYDCLVITFFPQFTNILLDLNVLGFFFFSKWALLAWACNSMHWEVQKRGKAKEKWTQPSCRELNHLTVLTS